MLLKAHTSIELLSSAIFGNNCPLSWSNINIRSSCVLHVYDTNFLLSITLLRSVYKLSPLFCFLTDGSNEYLVKFYSTVWWIPHRGLLPLTYRSVVILTADRLPWSDHVWELNHVWLKSEWVICNLIQGDLIRTFSSNENRQTMFIFQTYNHTSWMCHSWCLPPA